ncbi:hypothetical protein BCR34DRAFT_602488 [Clohesyomyces aquaticus]|uniref:DUF6590 domain-containing protein n=1 Tax=Clohesyomyces aquaticus TaxID=1231657 RepID=A0A1Y1ZJ89_9PLEO|nr:hypothetical protein BCR34DRAFT_602488 [Clohesyomyces aquaticus]
MDLLRSHWMKKVEIESRVASGAPESYFKISELDTSQDDTGSLEPLAVPPDIGVQDTYQKIPTSSQRTFFCTGRAFELGSFVENSLDSGMYTGTYLVVENKESFSYCHPIHTWAEPGTSTEEFAIIYTSLEPPEPFLGERLTRPSIRVQPSGKLRFHPGSRADFGRIYVVNHNEKVRDIGQVVPEHLILLAGVNDKIRHPRLDELATAANLQHQMSRPNRFSLRMDPSQGSRIVSDEGRRIGRNNQTTLTSSGKNGESGEIRLRVDPSKGLSLQLNGDFEGRTIRVETAEDGMSDIVVNARDSTNKTTDGDGVKQPHNGNLRQGNGGNVGHSQSINIGYDQSTTVVDPPSDQNVEEFTTNPIRISDKEDSQETTKLYSSFTEYHVKKKQQFRKTPSAASPTVPSPPGMLGHMPEFLQRMNPNGTPGLKTAIYSPYSLGAEEGGSF